MDPETLRKLAQGFIGALGDAKDAGGLIVRRPVVVREDSIDEKNRTIRMLASSDAVDSYGDIVEQDFLLDRYQKNPVVLYGHNRVGVFGAGGDPKWTLPIGYSTHVGVGADGLEATMHFVTKKANPFAEDVWQGIVERSIRASSIGFFPHDVEETQDEQSGETIFRLRKNELFEISIVPIGANPDAVMLGAALRKHEKAWFHARALDLRKTISVPPSPAPAPDPNETKAAPAVEETTMAMTDEEKKAFEAAQAGEKAANERATKAETELKTLKDAGAAAAIDGEVRALVGKKITENQVASFIALRSANPENFKAIVDGLATLPEASDEAAEKDVDALIGKKLMPAQKDAFLALRKGAPELFKGVAAVLLDLSHVKTITPPETKPTENKAVKKNGTSTIAKNAAAAAEKAREGTTA